MKLSNLSVKGYRCCKAIDIEVSNIHAIVGANNAGKSTVLKALDFLFNASVKVLSEETFWNKDTTSDIRVEAVFVDLTDGEKTLLAPYLREDGSFHMARSASFQGGDKVASDEDHYEQIKISQHYRKLVPKYAWLKESNASLKSIDHWLKNENMTVNGQDFLAMFDTKKPSVELWKQKAKEFIASALKPEDFEDVWEDNPKGYPGVLKGALPFFVLIPAVRDVAEEAKVLKTNPFGRLLAAVMSAVAVEKKSEIETVLHSVTRLFNRLGGDDRLPQLSKVENELNKAIAHIFAGCELEIEFATPNFENLVSSPRLFADDGFRGLIEHKGHGLQRAVIFSILRNYAALITGQDEAKHRTLILAVEEPELYMHPLAQRAIRRLFRDISHSGDQILYTTHSALMVDVADFDTIIRIESEQVDCEGRKALCAKVRQLPVSKMIEDEVARYPFLVGKVTADSIRDHYSNAYNRSRNEGFFGKKIMLVEGLTEEYSLPIYASALGIDLDLEGISVIECGGKCAMDRFYRVFNELGIPTFMIFDYDHGNDSEIVAKSRELLSLVGEVSQPPSGLVVKSRTAYFQKTWEHAFTLDVPDYSVLETQAKKHLGKAIGKPMIARYIAREHVRREPPFVPASIKAILEKAVQVDCGPSCLKMSVAAPSPSQ